MQKQHAYAVVIHLVMKSKWISHRELHNLVWSHKVKDGLEEVCAIYVDSCFLQSTNSVIFCGEFICSFTISEMLSKHKLWGQICIELN